MRPTAGTDVSVVVGEEDGDRQPPSFQTQVRDRSVHHCACWYNLIVRCITVPVASSACGVSAREGSSVWGHVFSVRPRVCGGDAENSVVCVQGQHLDGL